MIVPDSHVFHPGNGIPNSPLPLLVYRGALTAAQRHPEGCQALFRQNGWGGLWLNGIFSYWHFHTRGHEVLGCVGGHAEVGFGGPQGIETHFAHGDVVLIPAGVGHKRLSASSEFLVVGGYPPNQDGSILEAGQIEFESAVNAVGGVPMPRTDPVTGGAGGLHDLWL